MKKNYSFSTVDSIAEQLAQTNRLMEANKQTREYVESLDDFSRLFMVKVTDASDIPAGENTFLDTLWNNLLAICELEGSPYKDFIAGVEKHTGKVLVIPVRKGKGDGSKGKFTYSPFGKQTTSLVFGDTVTKLQGLGGEWETVNRDYVLDDGKTVVECRSGHWVFSQAITKTVTEKKARR